MSTQLLEKKENAKQYLKELVFDSENSLNEINTADVFRLIRISLGYSQQELADKMGVSSKSVYRWEKGGTLPDLTLSQYLFLYTELKKIGINLLNFNCYRVFLTSNEIEKIDINNIDFN